MKGIRNSKSETRRVGTNFRDFLENYKQTHKETFGVELSDGQASNSILRFIDKDKLNEVFDNKKDFRGGDRFF